MLDLEPLSGLPLQLDENGRIVFGPDVVVDETRTRVLDELTAVALEPEVCRGSQAPAYYMYNGVYRKGDRERLDGVPLRYELTLMPPGNIGREKLKTHGHLHNAEPRSGITYAEVCEVLVGTAHFVFQTLDTHGPSASLAFYIEARAGEKVIIPPDLDHLTINPGPGPLLFSDVIALAVTGVYDRYRASRGAAYLEVGDDGHAEFIPNPAYRAVPPLRKIAAHDYPALDLAAGVPLYTAFVRGRGENWRFLIDPREFWRTFPDLANLNHTYSSQ